MSITPKPRLREFRLSRRESVLSGKLAAGAAAAQLTRNAAAQVGAASDDPEKLFGPSVAGGFSQSEPAGDSAANTTPADDVEAQIEAVRNEGLTARQLRLSRRIAAMHGIEVESDEEAVVRLRAQGIDPFHRSSLNKIVAQAGADANRAAPTGQQMVPLGAISPAQRASVPGAYQPNTPRPAGPPPPLSDEARAAEISRIQRDLARRRRKRMAWLMLRMALFVLLPTIVAGWYYFRVATPLYSTKSQFLIQQADTAAVGNSSILSGIQLNPDSVSVQSYLTSRDAMLRLDADLGFRRAFSNTAIDPIVRLPENATNEETYKQYERSVKIGYDPTDGVLNMEVIAPDPAMSEAFSRALISYAEEMVDQMTVRLREDQMRGAEQSYLNAEANVRDAQMRVQTLQEQLGVLDPAAEGSVVMNQIANLEQQLTEKRLELGQLESNPRPNQSRVQGVRGDISRLEAMLTQTRAQLTEGSDARRSLAAISGELRVAEADLLTRQTLLAASAELLEAARIEANKQVRYLSLSVAPVPPDEATYPKAFQNTLVALLIFLGIYLMLSLTASILREQVSS
ncbi:MAG: capsule biosynthesis protein [Paracoccus sp. (in: a-proteobacteria)]|nr:capsule biosynthesis protein [Paracoccus sp. (in: a-proteobacteria)]